MKRTNLETTDDLKRCLTYLGKHGPVNPQIEAILRKSKPIRDAAAKLGIEWTERPGMGRPPKKASRI